MPMLAERTWWADASHDDVWGNADVLDDVCTDVNDDW